MALLITLFLVLINIFNNMSSNSPHSESGFTAVSSWLFSCIMFVFGALAGYTMILYKLRMKRKVRMTLEYTFIYLLKNRIFYFSYNDIIFNYVFLKATPTTKNAKEDKDQICRRMKSIDATFLLVFPIFFVFFVFVYVATVLMTTS